MQAPTDEALQAVLHKIITRPALANERVQTNASGQVVLKLKTRWRDGTTHLVLPAAGVHAAAGSPGTQTQAAPDPLWCPHNFAARSERTPLREHGVLAPNAKLRALVVRQVPGPEAQAAPAAECEANCSHHRPVPLSCAWLLKRVFEIDLEHCPNCGGELKSIAVILEQPVIEKILMHPGLQARAPPRSAARGQALQAD